MECISQRGVKAEGLATLNQTLMRRLLSCYQVFGGRTHFSTCLPILAFIDNVSLCNPSLDPSYAVGGGGVALWITHQVTVEAYTSWGEDASLLAQQLDGGFVLSGRPADGRKFSPVIHTVRI